ncbi:MAG: hypothetical protein LBI53_05760 [Candidatus Peribacteria bacterium]|nr:hypothetical protein [Candidatus Peribacteria bacterium]
MAFRFPAEGAECGAIAGRNDSNKKNRPRGAMGNGQINLTGGSRSCNHHCRLG